MALGTKNDLIKAANGVFRPRQVPPIETQGGDPYSPYVDALRRRTELSMNPQDRAYYGVVPSSISMPLTKTYSGMMTGLTRPSGGLSSEGKYGGFFSAGDLESAISGSAMRFATEAPSALRAQAGQRYNELNRAYSNARPSSYQTRRLMGNIRPGEGTEGLQRFFGSTDLQRQYAQKLSDWYAQNAAPAEEYLATAQQIESTPVSNLASAIASQTYGMNPDLARGKFAGLDKRMFEEQRDLQYRQQYGIPYDQYQFQQEQATGAARDAAKAQIAQIESATGIPISRIRDYSLMNDKTLYETINMQDVQYEDNNGEIVSVSAPQAIAQALSYMNPGGDMDVESLQNFIANIRLSEGQDNIARLIEAIVGLQARSSTRNLGYVEDYYLTNPYVE